MSWTFLKIYLFFIFVLQLIPLVFLDTFNAIITFFSKVFYLSYLNIKKKNSVKLISRVFCPNLFIFILFLQLIPQLSVCQIIPASPDPIISMRITSKEPREAMLTLLAKVPYHILSMISGEWWSKLRFKS